MIGRARATGCQGGWSGDASAEGRESEMRGDASPGPATVVERRNTRHLTRRNIRRCDIPGNELTVTSEPDEPAADYDGAVRRARRAAFFTRRIAYHGPSGKGAAAAGYAGPTSRSRHGYAVKTRPPRRALFSLGVGQSRAAEARPYRVRVGRVRFSVFGSRSSRHASAYSGRDRTAIFPAGPCIRRAASTLSTCPPSLVGDGGQRVGRVGHPFSLRRGDAVNCERRRRRSPRLSRDYRAALSAHRLALILKGDSLRPLLSCAPRRVQLRNVVVSRRRRGRFCSANETLLFYERPATF